MIFESDEQKAFRLLVEIKARSWGSYVEYGDTFTRFKCPFSDKLFEVRLKEVQQKRKVR